MKIACLALVYGPYQNSIMSLTAIQQHAQHPIDFYVVENKGVDTPYFKTFVDGFRPKKHILFHENISNNAIMKVLDDRLIKLSDYDIIILTDADLVPDPGWLDEHLNILRKNKEVFCVASSLKKENLPTETFPESVNWIPKDIKEHKNFIEAKTGTHLLTFREDDFWLMVMHFLALNKKFVDSNYHAHADYLLMKWGRTKNTSSRHLTWDVYADKDHPYTQEKMRLTDIWNHDRMSAYTVREY